MVLKDFDIDPADKRVRLHIRMNLNIVPIE